ncbi:histidine kinase [Vallitalea pronyensis]|uniref:histidine kinase n=2 Tax=Vallitalea pronyensis TaxID=1348613 RepID=A0A8J8MNZ5_9FIRM|nr:histidine kinase [Vallitalea pronyensis]
MKMRLYRFKHVQTKMLLVILIFLVLPLLIISYRYSKTTEDILREQIKKENARDLEQLNKVIEDELDKVVKAMNFFAINKQVKEVLFNGTPSIEADEWEKLQHYYKNYLVINDSFNIARETILSEYNNTLTLFDFQNNIYTSLPKRNSDKDIAWREQTWFADSMKDKGYQSWVFHWDHDKHVYLITLARLINESAELSWRGVMTITYEEQDLIYDLLTGENDDNILVVDKGGTVVSDVEREHIGTNLAAKPYVNAILYKNRNHFSYEEDGNHQFISYTKNSLTGWYLIKVSNYENLFSQVIDQRSKNLILLLGVLLIFIIISYILIYSITLPLKKLMLQMQDVEQGKFDLTVPVKGRDEIAQLGKRFNITIHQINQLIRNIQQEKEKEKALMLQVLYAQINPHFLFNTLNTIKWIAVINQAPNVADLIASLGRLLEMSIGKMNECIPIGDEIENINSYLNIQKARYNQQFTMSITLQEGIKTWMVPKLILQPLVENTLIHGIKGQEEKNIHIEIKGYIEDENLCFRVEDNGVGVEPEHLKQLVASMEKNETKGRYSGIGLGNVHQRIKLMFGEAYGLKLFSQIGKGIKITIVLPIIREADYDKSADS